MKLVLLVPHDEKGQYENQLLSDYKALGLKEHLSDDHELVIINNDEDLDEHLEDVEVVISSPFLPSYITKDRMEKAPNLKLSITAGVGSDHVDLAAAQEKDISVVEVTGSNQVSTAEHAVTTMFLLLRNFQEGNRQAREGEWDLPKVGNNAYDIEGKTIGIMGFGKIGNMVAERIKPFGVNILHYDPQKKEDTEISKAAESFDTLLEESDVVTVHVPLSNSTEGLFDKETLNKMKEGSYLINVARGAVVDRDALVDAINTEGHIRAYGGDVWDKQPAPSDHPWRNLTHTKSAMVPHMGGMTVDAQRRIEDGVKDLLDTYIKGEKFPDEHVIVQHGEVSSSYTQ
ncbi:NAD-dependent formate dehydrogenase [Salinicoccus albus]|uniref:NAD-dependent formate dehydrogenase n=1 Tax=Salinicoccus albus TaxID=418756 RepID=UPI0003744183|nr:NAD-dependent formate dehydrogenase [Salinicoccus albus]